MIKNDVILQRIDRTRPRDEGNIIRLSNIHDYLSQGMTTRDITENHPEIRPETVTLARAFLIAQDSKGYRDLLNNNSTRKKYKILIDENLSPQIVKFLNSKYKYVAHTRDVELNGIKDPDIWDWAVENKIDVVFTKDVRQKSTKDLTQIAIDSCKNILEEQFECGQHTLSLASLPLIVHIKANGKHAHERAATIFLKNAGEIQENIENRASPYIEITASGIVSGPPLAKLRTQITTEESLNIYESRRKNWIDKWTEMVLNHACENLTNAERRRIHMLIDESASICITPEKNIKQYRADGLSLHNSTEPQEPSHP